MTETAEEAAIRRERFERAKGIKLAGNPEQGLRADRDQQFRIRSAQDRLRDQ